MGESDSEQETTDEEDIDEDEGNAYEPSDKKKNCALSVRLSFD